MYVATRTSETWGFWKRRVVKLLKIFSQSAPSSGFRWLCVANWRQGVRSWVLQACKEVGWDTIGTRPLCLPSPPPPGSYLRARSLEQEEGLVGEEVCPLHVALLLGVQGSKLQGVTLILFLIALPFALPLAHQALVAQEVFKAQLSLCGATKWAVPTGPASPRVVPRVVEPQGNRPNILVAK